MITKSDPIKYLLARTVLMGRAARWFLILSEYEIKCLNPKAIKSQALADLLAHFPSGEYEPPTERLPGDELRAAFCDVAFEEWQLEFDGSSAQGSGGAGIVLSRGDKKIQFSYKLMFPCSNNEAEYEALALGLIEALNQGVQAICIKGDSNLVVKQVSGDFALKHPNLAPYRAITQHLLEQFEVVKIDRQPRTANRHPDALATLASKVDVPGDSTAITVHKRIVPTTILDFLPAEDYNDWRSPIVAQLQTRQGPLTMNELQKYCVIQRDLYHRFPCGLLARCVGPEEAAKKLSLAHELHCGTTDVSLYRRSRGRDTFGQL